jgi:hypothetical protein
MDEPRMKGEAMRAFMLINSLSRDGYQGSFKSVAHGRKPNSIGILITRNKLLMLQTNFSLLKSTPAW